MKYCNASPKLYCDFRSYSCLFKSFSISQCSRHASPKPPASLAIPGCCRGGGVWSRRGGVAPLVSALQRSQECPAQLQARAQSHVSVTDTCRHVTSVRHSTVIMEYYVKSILLKTSFLNMYLKHTKLRCFYIFCCNFPPRSLSLNFILNLMYKVGGGGDNHMNLKTTNVKPLQFYVIISKSL